MNLETLDVMHNATEVDRSQLVDIHTIKIDKSLPAAQRAEQYLEQIKNPYSFLCGDSVVRVSFDPNGKPLRDHLKNYFISCKKA